jgi:hypothetical protein
VGTLQRSIPADQTMVRHRAAGLRILRSRRSNFWTLRVGSIGVENANAPGVVCATSAVSIYRQRGNKLELEIIPARHRDLIRIGNGQTPRLLSRTVLITEKSLATTNLAIIL